jgi:hypothetical protein
MMAIREYALRGSARNIQIRLKSRKPFGLLALALLPLLSLSPYSVFAATQEAETHTLLISDVSISNVGYHSVTISWKTNIPATSQVFYDLVSHENFSDYAYHTDEDGDLVSEHHINLVGLYSGTRYHFRVRSALYNDPQFVEAISDDYVFTTRYSGSGGDGGVVPQYYYLKVNMLVTTPEESTKWPISKNGHLLQTVDVASANDEIAIIIPNGTQCLDEDGDRLREITVAIKQQVPELPSGCCLVSDVYEIEPDGATFDSCLKLSLGCEAPSIQQEEIQGDELYIAYYDDSTGWVPLQCAVDAGITKVAADIAHLCTFALMAEVPPPAPAEFSLSGMTISPSEVKPGEAVTIVVEVVNAGGREGSHTISLLVKQVLEASEEVTLAPQASDIVTFVLNKEEVGSYAITVGGLAGEFTVLPFSTPSPVSTTKSPPPPPSWISLNWWIVVIVAAVAGVLAYLLVRRHRSG